MHRRYGHDRHATERVDATTAYTAADSVRRVGNANPTKQPSASVVPVTASTLAIDWKADDPTGLGPVQWLTSVARSGDAYVLVAELPNRDGGSEFAAWWSSDGRAWELAQELPAGERILAVTAGGPGFVMSGFDDSGATVWTSADGRAWQAVRDASLGQGVIAQLVPTASGVVGFGWYWNNDVDIKKLWTSPDGSGVARAHERDRPDGRARAAGGRCL